MQSKRRHFLFIIIAEQTCYKFKLAEEAATSLIFMACTSKFKERKFELELMVSKEWDKVAHSWR